MELHSIVDRVEHAVQSRYGNEWVDPFKTCGYPKIRKRIPRRCREWMDTMKVELEVVKRCDMASYYPIPDKIVVQNVVQCKDIAHYTQVLSHEMIHATGKSNRLGRGFIVGMEHLSGFGFYEHGGRCTEEIVAEIGGMLLVDELGMLDDVVLNNCLHYISMWLGHWPSMRGRMLALKEGCVPLVEEAVTYILNLK